MVLRSRPRCRAIAEIVQPWRRSACTSMSSSRVSMRGRAPSRWCGGQRPPSSKEPPPSLAELHGWGLSVSRSGDLQLSAVTGGERFGEVGEVAVVDAAVVELAAEGVKQPGSIPAPRRGRGAALHGAVDCAYGRQAGGGRPGLFPRSLPTRRRTPLWKSPRGLDNDRASAPAACPGGQPPRLHGRLIWRSQTCPVDI